VYRALSGRQGDSYDNALAETINGLYKAEVIYRRAPWKTKESVELATLEWVSWFNHSRLLEPFCQIPQAKTEASYCLYLAVLASIAPFCGGTVIALLQVEAILKKFGFLKIMSTYVKADSPYRLAVEAPGRELSAAFELALKVKPNLQGDDITKAVLLRVKSYLNAQDLVKHGLDKVYAAPAADFFVETVTFYLRVVLHELAPELRVASEQNVVRRRGSLRPDISVWRGSELVAAIECKTQLGWNRDGWLKDFEYRESILRTECPLAKLYLLVLTGSNWPGFGNDHRIRKQFFVLLSEVGPRHFEESTTDQLADKIELLIMAIVGAVDT